MNWDPVLETSLSDLEVVNKDLTIKIWEIKYQLEATDKFVTVATTRPETLLGDMALAVNPSDKRFSHLIGKKASLPLCNRLIPIVADSYVDRIWNRVDSTPVMILMITIWVRDMVFIWMKIFSVIPMLKMILFLFLSSIKPCNYWCSSEKNSMAWIDLKPAK